MKCERCGQEFQALFDTNICGNCADDLTAEIDAYQAELEMMRDKERDREEA